MKIRPRQFQLASLLLCSVFSCAPAGAEEGRLSLMVQNDVFVGSDGGGYTSGITLSHLRSVAPGEASIAPLPVIGTVAPWFGVGPAALTRFSLSQILVTPRDLTRKEPDPLDAPYLGALWLGAGQVSVDDNVADMFGVRLGVIGPAAGGRRSQTLIHRLIGSDRPEGWDSQGPTRLLLGVERYRAWRLASAGADDGRAHADAVVSAGATAGNLQSSLGASVLLRYGTGLQRNFPSAIHQEIRGGDPVFLGNGWFVYAGLVGDRVFSHAGIGRNHYPGSNIAELNRNQTVVLAGIAYGFKSASVSFSLQRASPLITSSAKREPYGSLTLTIPL
ncbi:lipid A deacylase LpxR family protein [Duganella sp. CF517]|uniref:lipid A deacylase LpxR family protein n=1 Tax=Duganella sp. CF517 TaxID=1881038 RepID=UPI000B7E54E3